jgi:hypothetical protein
VSDTRLAVVLVVLSVFALLAVMMVIAFGGRR